MATNPDVRKTNLVVESFEVDDDHECWYLGVEETYAIIDPNLPYAERFRTEGVVLGVHDEEGTVEIEIEVSPERLIDIGLALAGAGRALQKEGRRA